MNRSPAACFADAYRGFEDACQSAGRIDRFYGLGSVTVRLTFAGPALLPLLTPALAHLSVDTAAQPDLSVCVWEQVPLDRAVRPFVPGAARFAREGELCMTVGPGRSGLSLLDCRRNLALYSIAEAGEIPAYATAAPFLDILHWWMRLRGAGIVHAAALGTPTGGVLLVGKGGAGKSTTALACLGEELRHAADDHCLITPADPPTAWSLYSSAKLRSDQLERFRALHCGARERFDEGKAIVVLYPRERDKLIAHFPLRAILAVRVTGRQDTALSRAAPAAVLQALAPSTVLQLRGADQRDLSFLADLARRVPGYFLDVGTNLTRIKPTIADLLSDMSGPR